jgi:hypothetical protein
MHKIPRGSSENAQNPRKNFQKCTKSNEELPKIILEVLHVIFCIFGRNSQDVVQFLKFFIGLLAVPYEILCII